MPRTECRDTIIMTEWFYESTGKIFGPVTREKIVQLVADGVLHAQSPVWTQEFGTEWKSVASARIAGNVSSPPPLLKPSPHRADEQELVRRMADYQRISGALWVAIGILQCIAVFTIIAGIWNISAGWSRFNISKRILARDATVPAEFQPVGGLVTIGVVNLLFGAAFGVLFVLFDFFIRDKVLSNAAVFNVDIGSPTFKVDRAAATPGTHRPTDRRPNRTNYVPPLM